MCVSQLYNHTEKTIDSFYKMKDKLQIFGNSRRYVINELESCDCFSDRVRHALCALYNPFHTLSKDKTVYVRYAWLKKKNIRNLRFWQNASFSHWNRESCYEADVINKLIIHVRKLETALHTQYSKAIFVIYLTKTVPLSLFYFLSY